ncbi:hypothetical protein ONZ51_g7844 [Trametes cubensis]|uniref:Heterokaryon incompatibility domain-containing protein n=1 Tax=Trametes cubensis TaxID=1111947 RepID=A0AAD7TRY6_9APHY|nr:hypothetical protein ONZ51_g7844 [Trametes cubensis]
MRGQYVALSYVWGGQQRHRTTKNNLASYIRHGINPAILPRTIQDAIRVTRALGLRFLWLDSLCIIQDSEEDKHRELASMRNVYRYAYVTIDAARAAKATEGFLQDGSALAHGATLPFVHPIAHRSYPGYPIGQLGNLYLDATPWDKETNADRLSRTNETGRRGWCLQETLLSTRSLVFTSETLQLRCQQVTQNVGGADHNESYDLPRLPDVILRSGDSAEIERGSRLWKEICCAWRGIVENYSRRSLSYSSDKLIACAAIAEMFAPVLGPDYLAGLWRSTLLEDLLWRRDSRDQGAVSSQRRPQQDTRAPTWSWASFDGPVEYLPYLSRDDGRETIFLAEVVTCTVAPQDQELPYGPARIGSVLVLRSKCTPCRYADHGDYLRVERTPAPSERESVKPPLLVAQFRLDRPSQLPRRRRCFFSRPQELWLVPLTQDVSGNISPIRGLVVARARRGTQATVQEENQRDVFRRVGLFWAFPRTASTLKFFDNVPTVEIVLV